MSIMTRIVDAVSEIEKARIERSNGDIFAMVSELDVLLKWRNWALCDNSLLDYTDMFHESEEGILRRHR